MTYLEQYQKDLLKEIDLAVERFLQASDRAQTRAFSDVVDLLKQLDTKRGVVLVNKKNLAIIRDIRKRLNRSFLNPEYKAAVEAFLRSYDNIAALQVKYFKTIDAEFDYKETLKEITKQAKTYVLEQLLGSGFESGIVTQVEDIIRQNVTGRASYADLVKQISAYLADSTSKSPGKIAAWSRQIVTDGLNQFSAQFSSIVSEDLGLEWYMYVGSNIETTRQFCQLMTHKKWVHKSELPIILRGSIDGTKYKVSKTTGLWYGAVPGTNAGNFYLYRGGYNCGHQYLPVSAVVVPLAVKNKLKAA